jgi:hypothetical protein
MGKGIKQASVSRSELSLKRKLIAIPISIFVVKIIVMLNASGDVWESWSGGWAGADGEHYIIGMLAILVDGVFSDDIKLLFWPAGYPLLMSIFGNISSEHTLYFVSIIQSAFYAYASYYFVENIRKSSVKIIAFSLALFLGLNPTLSLSSLVVGYESLAASCMLLIVAKIAMTSSLESKKVLAKATIFIGGFLALVSFIQPRYLTVGLVLIPLWVLFEKNKRKATAIVGLFALLIMFISPGVLMVRNHFANDKWAISTNLGSTMRIGAGPMATGGYIEGNRSVPCTSKSGKGEPSDSELQRCVITWYLSNPTSTLKLALNKSIYFWSPWSGPLANGTMARNPWLKIDPVMNIAKNEEGRNLVTGAVGKIVSWIWLLGGLGLLFVGLIWLHRAGGQMRRLAWLSFTPVAISWLVSIATIGDHRFRLPTLGLSLFLQVAGFFGLKNGLKIDKIASTFEQTARSR